MTNLPLSSIQLAFFTSAGEQVRWACQRITIPHGGWAQIAARSADRKGSQAHELSPSELMGLQDQNVVEMDSRNPFLEVGIEEVGTDGGYCWPAVLAKDDKRHEYPNIPSNPWSWHILPTWLKRDQCTVSMGSVLV